MFQYNIDDMRDAIGRIVARERPPEIVRIKLIHAEYLGVKWWFSKPIEEKRTRRSKVVTGVPYGTVVCVYVLDLYNALKDAQGVEVKDQLGKQVQGYSPGTHDSGNGKDDPVPNQGQHVETGEGGDGS